MYPSVIYKNCRRGKEAFGAWQHRTVDLSDLFKLEPYLGFLKLHCGLVACFLVLGFVKVKINGLEYYQALCVYLDTESVSSFWETQYSRLFKIQSLIGLLRSSIVIPVSLHRLVMNRMIVVKYGVGGVGRFGICVLKLSLHQSRPTGYSRLLENISVGREERPYNTRSLVQQTRD